jgi:hypothetical protein
VLAGYLLFIGMMAMGYFYNVTFVQLGRKRNDDYEKGERNETVNDFNNDITFIDRLLQHDTGGRVEN